MEKENLFSALGPRGAAAQAGVISLYRWLITRRARFIVHLVTRCTLWSRPGSFALFDKWPEVLSEWKCNTNDWLVTEVVPSTWRCGAGSMHARALGTCYAFHKTCSNCKWDIIIEVLLKVHLPREGLRKSFSSNISLSVHHNMNQKQHLRKNIAQQQQQVLSGVCYGL